MDPVTLAGISAGASAAGAGVDAIGKLFGGQSQAGAFKYQAGVALMNEQIAKENADFARHTGEVQAQQSGMKTRFEIGSTKTTQSARGLDLNAGSASDVRDSEVEIGRYDQSMIRSNAARQAYGYEIEAASQKAQAGMYASSAKSAKVASIIGAAGSILGGASSVSSKWLQGKQVGIFG